MLCDTTDLLRYRKWKKEEVEEEEEEEEEEEGRGNGYHMKLWSKTYISDLWSLIEKISGESNK